MDRSFLTWINLGLGIYCIICFVKMLIQFGLSNHPSRFSAYLIVLCVTSYFVGLSLTDLGYLSPFFWMKWRVIPLVAGSLSLLLQMILLGNQLSRIQQKLISRLPIIASLLFFAFFSDKGNYFLIICLLLCGIFLSVSVGKVRYQKRQFFKMIFFLSLSYGCKAINQYTFYIIGELLVFFALFYFFIFEHSVAVTALVDDFKSSIEGDS